jgi:uncharacterized protein YjdB
MAHSRIFKRISAGTVLYCLFVLCSCKKSTDSSTVSVTGVNVSPATLSLTVGGAASTLEVTVSPSNADDTSVSWTTSDGSVATVGSSGAVTPVAMGNATITATTTDGGKAASCAATVYGSSSASDLAIAGKWHMATRDQDITFTNTTIVFNAGANSGLTGTILSYDNGGKYLVMQWTNHPAYTGKYQRWNWVGSPASSLDIGTELDTAAQAIADTSAKYTDTITRIIFSDDFDRADTTSPSVGNALWTIAFMPLVDSTYFISYPDSSTPVVSGDAIKNLLAADTWYRLEISKVGADDLKGAASAKATRIA